MKVEFFDRISDNQLMTRITDAINRVIANRDFILGDEVKQLENTISDFCGCRFGVGVSSGTDALLLSLMAEGIGPGDKVITTPYSFVATIEVISRVGATPVLVDINSRSYNINVKKIDDEIKKLGSDPVAIIPVHLFGQCADMEAILTIAKEYNMVVIEDAAQAIGATSEVHGRTYRAGSMGDYGCFSFFPTKNLGGYGDGGMIVTNDILRAEKLIRLRSHGFNKYGYVDTIGGNFRLDTIQAAILMEKFYYLEAWNKLRNSLASKYTEEFGSLSSDIQSHFTIPTVHKGHVFNQYVIRVQNNEIRNDLKDYLSEAGIETKIYYKVPFHVHPYYKTKVSHCPTASDLSCESLSLPCRPSLTDVELKYVVSKIGSFYEKGKVIK